MNRARCTVIMSTIASVSLLVLRPHALGARPAQGFGAPPPIVKEYDVRRDTTIVKFQFAEDDHRLWSPTGSLTGIEFDVRYTYRGQGRERLSDVVTMSLAVQRSAPPPAGEPQELMLVADGQRIQLTQTPDVAAKSGDDYFFETSASIPRAEFQKIVSASRADGSWIGIKFVISDYQKGFLKGFAALEYPPD